MLKILCPWRLNNAKAAGLGETCPKKIFSSTLPFQCIQKYRNCAENVSHNRSMESFVPGAIEWHVVELGVSPRGTQVTQGTFSSAC